MGFSRQDSWSGLTFPPPGDFPDLALEPGPPAAIALEGDFITIKPPGKPWKTEHKVQMEDLKNNCFCVYMLGHSVVSDFWGPHGLWPGRLSAHGISQARIVECVAISYSRGSS